MKWGQQAQIWTVQDQPRCPVSLMECAQALSDLFAYEQADVEVKVRAHRWLEEEGC